MEAHIIRAYDALDETCCNLEEAVKRVDVNTRLASQLLIEVVKVRNMQQRLWCLTRRHNPAMTRYLEIPTYQPETRV